MSPQIKPNFFFLQWLHEAKQRKAMRSRSGVQNAEGFNLQYSANPDVQRTAGSMPQLRIARALLRTNALEREERCGDTPHPARATRPDPVPT